jgi:hypothetical protein
LVERDIDPHIPVWDQSEVAAEGKFTRADFAYDKDRDLYICPGGKELKTSGNAHDGKTLKYIAKKSDCTGCPLKPRRATSTARRIQRDVNQGARDGTRSLMKTDAYRDSSIERKKIETPFGEVEHVLSCVRLRLRGLSGARDEFLLITTAQRSAIPPPRPSVA